MSNLSPTELSTLNVALAKVASAALQVATDDAQGAIDTMRTFTIRKSAVEEP